LKKAKEENIFLYLAHDDEALTPMTENEVLKDYIKQGYLAERYGSYEKTACYRENGDCYVCGQEEIPVYGNFSLITCYNLDKESAIAGGFLVRQAVNNFPVCADCILDISDGFKFARDELTSNMAGLQYMALPKALTGDRDIDLDLIDELIKRYKKRQQAGELRQIAGTENELIQMLDQEDFQDNVALLLVFFAKSKAQWSILLEVEELLPSRVRIIKETFEDVEAKVGDFFYAENWKYNFGILREVFKEKQKGDSRSDQKMIQYLEAIFSDRPLSEQDMLSNGVASILGSQKEALKGEQDISGFVVRDIFATWLFLKELQLFKDKKTGASMDYLEQFSGPYVDMIRELADFFDCPDKVAAFLIGCYVDSTAYAQGTQRGEGQAGGRRGNEPFRKKVIGRKMNPDFLKRLYPEAMSKLRQYDAFGLVARDLDPLTAYCIAQAGNKWNSSDEELTLAFSIGMSINSRIIKSAKEVEENAQA
jgi:CRISPR-associated protein Csh1